MDSGAFTEVSTHGHYRTSVEDYAKEIDRWATNGSGTLLAAVAQDFMCEPFIIEKTGRTVADHQRMTIERYDALLLCKPRVYIMPVLQGYAPSDYTHHIVQYGPRLTLGMWVGVGSVCKRNGDPKAVEAVFSAIKQARPDLRLHGFGLKKTSLASPLIHSLLESADSMAWSFHARINGRNGNSYLEALAWTEEVNTLHAKNPT